MAQLSMTFIAFRQPDEHAKTLEKEKRRPAKSRERGPLAKQIVLQEPRRQTTNTIWQLRFRLLFSRKLQPSEGCSWSTPSTSSGRRRTGPFSSSTRCTPRTRAATGSPPATRNGMRRAKSPRMLTRSAALFVRCLAGPLSYCVKRALRHLSHVTFAVTATADSSVWSTVPT
jgi:hypothetical protein